MFQSFAMKQIPNSDILKTLVAFRKCLTVDDMWNAVEFGFKHASPIVRDNTIALVVKLIDFDYNDDE